MVVLDIRVPCVPAATLVKHKAPVNGMVWAPHSSCHICTAADDANAVIWDVRSIPKVGVACMHTTCACKR